MFKLVKLIVQVIVRWSSFAGPTFPLQPANIRNFTVTHNTGTIQWTVSRIAYIPENYTVHFGTSPGSLTNVSQQQESGDDFIATNLQFSVQLTELSAGTRYYYQVVAMNSEGFTASIEQNFTTALLRKLFQVVGIGQQQFVYGCPDETLHKYPVNRYTSHKFHFSTS